jgi:hypothetical protein
MSKPNLVPRRPFRFFASLPESQRKSVLNTVIYMGEHGFHAKTIAKVAGLTPSQVYAICSKFGVRLRAYRDGRSEPAERVILRSPIVKVKKIKSPTSLRRVLS